MSQIKGLDNMSNADIKRELENGAQFVMFTYAISLLVITFRRSSDIYFVKNSDVKISRGWPFLMISLVLGWWGIPWGPIYTIQSMYHAFAGKDVTGEVLSQLSFEEAPQPMQGYNLPGGNNGDPYGMNNSQYPINSNYPINNNNSSNS